MKYALICLFCFAFVPKTFTQDSLRKFWLGKTTGNIPHLDYGLGEDRLGGAKMTYLDTNIVLKIIDSAGDNYKVQLSKYHSAYIYKSLVATDSLLISKPYYLTDKWMIWGDSTNDYVHIKTFDKLPYTSIQQLSPTRIVIDVFGAVSNTNRITQLNTAKEIKAAWYEQPEDDVMRVFIELNHPQIWGYHIAYDTSGLLVTVKRQKDILQWSKFTVAVDAGHGGSNVGAAGVTTKVGEKVYTLQFAKQLRAVLAENGFNVIMTRTKDTNIAMADRVLMMRSINPDILISLHLNSDPYDTVRGASTYYRYIGFRSLSQAIYNRMLALGLNEYGNSGSFNFGLSGPTEYPNCLVEIAFLSNKSDEKRIVDPIFQRQVAMQITEGLKDWLTVNNVQLPKAGTFIKQ